MRTIDEMAREAWNEITTRQPREGERLCLGQRGVMVEYRNEKWTPTEEKDCPAPA